MSSVLDLSGAYFSLDFAVSYRLGSTPPARIYSGMFSGIALDANNAHVAFYNHNESGLGAKETSMLESQTSRIQMPSVSTTTRQHCSMATLPLGHQLVGSIDTTAKACTTLQPSRAKAMATSA